jgi:pimeloyl-ACP methyl ester carboxylesterase
MTLHADLQRVAVDGGQLAYLDLGTGPPVVLLHGGALDHRMWSDQIPVLARDHRVIAVDARGHGRSSTPVGPFRHCDDLAAMLEKLQTGPATLVGLSLGGGTAVDTALEHPAAVAALVVSGTGTSEADFRDPWVLDVMAAWQRAEAAGDVGGWIEAFLRFAVGPRRQAADVDPDVIARCRRMALDTIQRHVLDHPSGRPVLPTAVTATWERSASIRVPVLTVTGDLDAADHLDMADRLARSVAGSRSVTIAGTAHYPNMERPEELNRAVAGFLSAVGA